MPLELYECVHQCNAAGAPTALWMCSSEFGGEVGAVVLASLAPQYWSAHLSY